MDHCQHNDSLIEGLLQDSAANKTEHQSFKRRLDELESSSKRQGDILLALQRQGDAIETMNKKIDNLAGGVSKIERRVEEIEQEPADRYKKLTFEAVKYILLAVIGAFVGYFIKGA